MIYQIKSLMSSPPLLDSRVASTQLELMWDRGTLQESADVDGEWNGVADTFSPHLVAPVSPKTFYRVG